MELLFCGVRVALCGGYSRNVFISSPYEEGTRTPYPKLCDYYIKINIL
jgi:hypothetical protein